MTVSIKEVIELLVLEEPSCHFQCRANLQFFSKAEGKIQIQLYRTLSGLDPAREGASRQFACEAVGAGGRGTPASVALDSTGIHGFIHRPDLESIGIHQFQLDSTKISWNPSESIGTHADCIRNNEKRKELIRIHRSPLEYTGLHQNTLDSIRSHQSHYNLLECT